MKARAMIVALALVGTAVAAPHRHHARGNKPAAGSGSGSGSGPAAATGSAPAPAPAPAPEPVTDTAPAVGPGPGPGSGSGSGARSPKPEARSPSPLSPPGLTTPPPAPRLAMRTKAHGGFVSDMDCSACHTSDGWQLAATAGRSGFDHDRTGFPLRGGHTQTTCTSCHTGEAKPANNCEGCHRDPHEGRHLGACAECHDAVAWSNTTVLEQHRRTRMPLTGRHAMIDCSDCHKRQGERQFSDTPTDCYACHGTLYHDNGVHPTHDGSTGQAPFPRDCALCHQTTAWSPAYAVPTALPRTLGSHDGWFVLTTGSHRTADCASCHSDASRPQLVRCDGCHTTAVLRTQHAAPVALVATACLGCHPRGAAR